MGQLFRRIASLLGLNSPMVYAYPALDITLPGERHFHLVGSIHMGTIDMSPLPDVLFEKLREADGLVVEADITSSESPFGQPEPQLPLAERLSAAQLEQLNNLCDELGAREQHLATLPAWQIALVLQAQQAQRLGLRAEYGIDYQLLNAARHQGKKVIELEGPQQQLELLQQLPKGGIALLEDTLTHWHTNARLLQTMVSWWMENQPKKFTDALPSTFSSALYDILMNQRNQRWQQQLSALPPGRYVVAVGALHLYGEGNLPDMLKAGIPH